MMVSLLFTAKANERRLVRLVFTEELSKDTTDRFDPERVRKWLDSGPRCCQKGHCIQLWYDERPPDYAAQVIHHG